MLAQKDSQANEVTPLPLKISKESIDFTDGTIPVSTSQTFTACADIHMFEGEPGMTKTCSRLGILEGRTLIQNGEILTHINVSRILITSPTEKNTNKINHIIDAKEKDSQLKDDTDKL